MVQDAPLFHATSLDDALRILASDRLRATTKHKIGFDEQGHWKTAKGVSLTRDWVFASAWSQVVFVLNQNRLRDTHKLLPVAFENYQTLEASQARGEAEEFVVGPVLTLHRYVDSILLPKHFHDEMRRNKSHNLLLDHPRLGVAKDTWSVSRQVEKFAPRTVATSSMPRPVRHIQPCSP